ncbi:hypothetical protein SESBI_17056 [Sesbania bispinosa]|nr:hypothetical protein SESBI_17056 [Sesbania bispinosa]
MTHPPDVMAQTAQRAQFSAVHEASLTEASLHPARHSTHMCVVGVGERSVTPGRRALGLMASGATCVQRLDGSQDYSIQTKYRIYYVLNRCKSRDICCR